MAELPPTVILLGQGGGESQHCGVALIRRPAGELERGHQPAAGEQAPANQRNPTRCDVSTIQSNWAGLLRVRPSSDLISTLKVGLKEPEEEIGGCHKSQSIGSVPAPRT
jgi:hypothetical protein